MLAHVDLGQKCLDKSLNKPLTSFSMKIATQSWKSRLICSLTTVDLYMYITYSIYRADVEKHLLSVGIERGLTANRHLIDACYLGSGDLPGWSSLTLNNASDWWWATSAGPQYSDISHTHTHTHTHTHIRAVSCCVCQCCLVRWTDLY